MLPIDFGINQVKVKVTVTDKAAVGEGMSCFTDSCPYLLCCFLKKHQGISVALGQYSPIFISNLINLFTVKREPIEHGPVTICQLLFFFWGGGSVFYKHKLLSFHRIVKSQDCVVKD